MTLTCLSTIPTWRPSAVSLPSSSSKTHVCQCSLYPTTSFLSQPMMGSIRGTKPELKGRAGVVCMAPDEEKLTRRNPLDFPIEWERPKPGRRPDIFPQFSPMKTPVPPPLPYDPPEEDEEEEEEEKKKEEEEEDPEKEEEPNKPDKL